MKTIAPFSLTTDAGAPVRSDDLLGQHVAFCWLSMGTLPTIRSERNKLVRVLSRLGSRNVRIVFVNGTAHYAGLTLTAGMGGNIDYLFDSDGSVLHRFAESLDGFVNERDGPLFVLEPGGNLVKWFLGKDLAETLAVLERYFSARRLIGDRIPDVPIQVWVKGKVSTCASAEWFGDRRVLVFAVPGAFTPVCDKDHLPGYVARTEEILRKGVDHIACFAVNDAYVLNAWGQTQRNAGKIVMVADGSARFAQAMGLTLDLDKLGLGIRSQRYAMIVDRGVITHLNVESGFDVRVSDAETMSRLLAP